MTDEVNMGKIAVWYARHGVPIFPLHYPMAGRCSCGLDCGNSAAKHPITNNGFKDATTNVAQVTDWWRQHPDANIGMPTGPLSRRIVMDTDPRNGGPEDRAEIIRCFGSIPETAEVATGGGGRHTHFQDPGVPIPKTLAKGVDLKGEGGYVVMPPSLHISGNRYGLDGMDAKALLNPAPAPEWLLKRIAAARNGISARTENGAAGAKLGQGERNNGLTSLAGTMRRPGMSLQAITAALLEENRLRCEPPLPEAEVRQIAESVNRYNPGEEQRQGAHTEAAGDWPKPEPMQDELPPVQAFSEDLLPESFPPTGGRRCRAHAGPYGLSGRNGGARPCRVSE